MFGETGKLAESRSGLRREVVPGIANFMDLVPKEAVVASQLQLPVVLVPQDQLVGVAEPDSKDPLGATLTLVVFASRKETLCAPL